MALRRYDLLKRRSSFFGARPSFVGRVVGWIAGGGAGGASVSSDAYTSAALLIVAICGGA